MAGLDEGWFAGLKLDKAGLEKGLSGAMVV